MNFICLACGRELPIDQAQKEEWNLITEPLDDRNIAVCNATDDIHATTWELVTTIPWIKAARAA